MLYQYVIVLLFKHKQHANPASGLRVKNSTYWFCILRLTCGQKST
jgi:hypothetical protein